MNITRVPCLAIIVSTHSLPENIGKIVRAVERVVGDRYNNYRITNTGDIAWAVESEGGLLVIRTRGGEKHFVTRRAYADCCLREIKGDEPEAQDELAKEKEAA